jgi:hypothetical protein
LTLIDNEPLDISGLNSKIEAMKLQGSKYDKFFTRSQAVKESMEYFVIVSGLSLFIVL